MPQFRDELLVTFAEGWLFISPDQPTAVQEELSQWRTVEGGSQLTPLTENSINKWTSGHNYS